jgi:hypothetical protein
MHLEPLHPIQIQRFREMSFAEKWTLAHGLWLMGFGSWRAMPAFPLPDALIQI